MCIRSAHFNAPSPIVHHVLVHYNALSMKGSPWASPAKGVAEHNTDFLEYAYVG